MEHDRVDPHEAGDGALDTAGVALPPPLLFAGVLALGLALGSGRRGAGFSRTWGLASIAAGLAGGAAAFAEMRRMRTPVDPYEPVKALATGGIFRFSRNPIYGSLTALYMGIALCARSVPALVFLPVALALLDRLVVDREERYLEERFGDVYRSYRAAVPRWF